MKAFLGILRKQCLQILNLFLKDNIKLDTGQKINPLWIGFGLLNPPLPLSLAKVTTCDLLLANQMDYV